MSAARPATKPASDMQELSPLRRELYFFTLYRVLQAGLLAVVTFSPLGPLLIDTLQPFVLKAASVLYLIAAAALVLASRRSEQPIRRQAAVGLCVDLGIAAVAMFAARGLEPAVALLMLINIAAGGLILTLYAGIGFALAAGGVLCADYVYLRVLDAEYARPAAEWVMFSVSYLAIVVLARMLSEQVQQAEALAARRGQEVENLAELNELVIRRMRAGVLVVDAQHRIQQANEAAWALFGSPPGRLRPLEQFSPALDQSLRQWRQGRGEIPKALRLGEGLPEVLPRFVNLAVGAQPLFLMFLEDSRVFTGRAEELTLATLGRLSASIAHEIRNPLAAINYAAQLLDESEQLGEADRRLLEIIHGQCQRMNGIIENVLGLARREPSQPETLDLSEFARRFVEDYRRGHPLETDQLQATGHSPVIASADPRHLHQVLTVLVHNALHYGRLPGEPARVTVACRYDEVRHEPVLEVLDRGPGIPAVIAERIFTPFFSTNEHGTGLGLYIARQLCEANLSSLDYVPVPGGGACFRIVLPPARGMARNVASVPSLA
jgi:two-component system sensor histidine kinase PilS (NtrC family)